MWTEKPLSAPEYDFELDRFQREAIDALDAGQSVLVAAPTGSGKTVVAEHAVQLALERGGKAFYTTPIKALSNQKFHDLVRRHGSDDVGLLTGDNAINGDAPVVVMTTEVLRNMIYARSGALEGLLFVVLDEVHYLQDYYRGPVWEEVIVHLPESVRLVCLSATVSNTEELTEWMTTVRGETTAVLEERRPVALENLYAVDDRERGALVVTPVLIDGRPNARARHFDVDPRQGWRQRGRRRFATPSRLDTIDVLEERDLLPALYFIFSRVACDDAVKACVSSGHRLNDRDERARIREIVDQHVSELSDDDLEVLGYGNFVAGLEAGYAAHHAGMVPPFKEAVEACFVEGLVKAVFATETLALGINMPARTVVIEKLTKFTGERHEFLTPAQYTQLTGRAGRRGIDDQGTAVVLWSPFVAFDDIATLAASRSFRLTSAFRPTYNMAANLVRRYPAEKAHHLLNLSLAQFQADHAVVRLEARLAKREATLADLRAAAACELGDIDSYARERDEVRSRERRAREHDNAAVEDALRGLRPGDVIWLFGGKSAGPAAVLSVSHRRGGSVRTRLVTPQRRVLNLGAADFEVAPTAIERVELPVPYTPQSHPFQRDVAQRLARLRVARPSRRGEGTGTSEHGGRERGSGHPIDRCPDRDLHLRAFRQAERAEADVDNLKKQILARTESLARQFDRVLQLLERWGYLEGWALTRRGNQLVRIYHEADLLIAECLETGLLDDLDPASLAGLVSCFTYEHRSSTPPPEPWFPSAALRHRFEQIDLVAHELRLDEGRLGLPTTRAPDAGFLVLAHAWVTGEDLDEVLADDDLSGGDFVRNIKQLLDLLRQIGDAAPDPSTAAAARAAADAAHRGVVSASSAVAVGGNEGEGVDDDLIDAAP